MQILILCIPRGGLDQIMTPTAVKNMLQLWWPWRSLGNFEGIWWDIRLCVWSNWHSGFVWLWRWWPRRRWWSFGKGSKVAVRTVVIGTRGRVVAFAEVLEHHVQFAQRRSHWRRHDLESWSVGAKKDWSTACSNKYCSPEAFTQKMTSTVQLLRRRWWWAKAGGESFYFPSFFFSNSV